tara:strand:+ start:28489 stop:28797 length:309 start_codon:yes stop_codon:yes gene_type:complete
MHSTSIGGLDVWQKLNRILVALVALIASAALIAKFLPEIRRQSLLNEQIAELQSEEQSLRSKRDALKQDFEWLREEAAYRESVARDRLDLQRKGETIIRIQR